MKTVFVSNFLNHHQTDLCDYLSENCESFYFIEANPMPQETVNLGYTDYSDKKYICRIYESIESKRKAEQYVMDADVAIFGASSDEFLKMRTEKYKLSFIFSERIWKKGTYRRFIPMTYKKIHNRFLKNKKSNLYVLCASSFLPYDLKLVGFPIDKCFQWGYFPPVDTTDFKTLMALKPQKIRILWVGRFIPLKRAEDTLKAAKLLMENGYDFSLDFIGDGELKEKYKNFVYKYGMDNYVNFLGKMPTESVREEMKKSTFLIFNSTFKEGWGAVVNEAMNSACVPVVSHAAGCAYELIRNGENGFVYKMGDYYDLYRTLKFAIDNQMTEKCAYNAYNDILTQWNAKVAGRRLIQLANSIISGEKTELFSSGPCSPAKQVKNNWYKESIWKV